MKKTPGLEIYQSAKDGLWYWRLRSVNAKIVADGAEGYSTEAKARAGVRAARRMMACAEVA